MFGPVPRVARRLGPVVGLIQAVALVCAVVCAVPATAASTSGPIGYAGHPDAVAGSYVVVLRDEKDGAAVTDTVRALAARYDLDVRHTYTTALRGFAVHKATERQAGLLAADPAVASVTQDLTVRIADARPNACPPFPCVQPLPNGLPPPSWGLDRSDQRELPLDYLYHYPNTGYRVRAYVIDTGIRFSHDEFDGRAVFGIDTTGGNGSDCNGHGTHIAGVIGGETHGLAKQATLVSVRVFNCSSTGTMSGVLAGVDWVTADSRTSGRQSVASMAVQSSFFPPLNDAVTASIAAGVHYSVAAGNNNQEACRYSPASTPRATTVTASTVADAKASFSNHGPCVDLYAPGASIRSAWWTSDSATSTMSGTSVATAHVAGIAALWRYRFPNDTADQVATALTRHATPNLITGNPPNTPNLLAFMGAIPV